MVTVKRCFKLKKEGGGNFLFILLHFSSNLPLLAGKIDPYVRVFLMPGTHAELKTKVIKNELNPKFNDEFSFVVRLFKVLFTLTIYLFSRSHKPT